MGTLIKNAIVVDGTGNPARAADVLIEDGAILAVELPGALDAHAAATERVDAAGMHLMPGFIDVHSHSDYHLCIDHAADSKIRQGVTTEVCGNCGYSPAPVLGLLAEDRRKEYRNHYKIDCDWNTVGEFLGHLRNIGIPTHYAQLIGHNTVRASVMQGTAAAPDAAQLEQMKSLCRQGMREGAIGLSFGLIYAPGCFAQRDELVALCRVVAEEGGVLTTHMRSEGAGLVEAVEEVIGVAREAGIPLQISHLKTSGPKNWGKLDRVFQLIEDAKAEGLDVDVDRYPYTASYTGLASVLPNWCLEGTRADQMSRVRDPEVRRRALAEILSDHPEADYWDRIRVCQVFKEHNKPLEGRSVADIAREWNALPLDAACELLFDEEMSATAVYFTMSEENMRRILAKPYCMVGSDAAVRNTHGPLAVGKPHPRAYGTFPKYLEIVRDTGLLSLETAVRRATLDPAAKFKFTDRGAIAAGKRADLVLLDLGTVRDNATYAEPHQYPNGVARVWVEGAEVLSDGRPTGAMPGRVLP